MAKGKVSRGGRGLKVLSEARWYGPGYCGICGDRGESLIPKAVRWWDPDDGWKTGVLCLSCTEDAKGRGPQPGDYAYTKAGKQGAILQALTEVLEDDLDGVHSEYEDLS